MTCDVPDILSKNLQMSSFMNIRSVATELLHTNSHKERHNEADSRFSQYYENAPVKGQT